jgi:hypothetical protein
MQRQAKPSVAPRAADVLNLNKPASFAALKNPEIIQHAGNSNRISISLIFYCNENRVDYRPTSRMTK